MIRALREFVVALGDAIYYTVRGLPCRMGRDHVYGRDGERAFCSRCGTYRGYL